MQNVQELSGAYARVALPSKERVFAMSTSQNTSSRGSSPFRTPSTSPLVQSLPISDHAPVLSPLVTVPQENTTAFPRQFGPYLDSVATNSVMPTTLPVLEKAASVPVPRRLSPQQEYKVFPARTASPSVDSPSSTIVRHRVQWHRHVVEFWKGSQTIPVYELKICRIQCPNVHCDHTVSYTLPLDIDGICLHAEVTCSRCRVKFAFSLDGNTVELLPHEHATFACLSCLMPVPAIQSGPTRCGKCSVAYTVLLHAMDILVSAEDNVQPPTIVSQVTKTEAVKMVYADEGLSGSKPPFSRSSSLSRTTMDCPPIAAEAGRTAPASGKPAASLTVQSSNTANRTCLRFVSAITMAGVVLALALAITWARVIPTVCSWHGLNRTSPFS